MGILGALLVFVASAAYMLYTRRGRHLILAVGVTMVLYAASGGELMGSLLAGALAPILFVYFNPTYEGFEDKKDEEVKKDKAEEKEEAKEEKKETKEKFASGADKNPPPDHGDRGEFFELGKKYKLPNEKDDSDFHLDAGTTFMNAYKSLKPDQIAAMTKDTQELMETQKQLMSTLKTLKPLMTDGKQMMEMFQSYFVSGNPTAN